MNNFENAKLEIKEFLTKIKEKYGEIPKWNYSSSPNKLYYNTPFINDNEIIESIHTLLFSSWAASGPKIKEFEDEFSKLVGNKHTVTVSSGSDANLLMISALKEYYNWADGSNLLLSIAGFPTTYSAVIFNNLELNLVDIESDTLNFNLDKLESQINDKTVGIFISAPLGNLPDLDRLTEISKKYNIKLIADGCDSNGCKYKNKEINEYCVATSCSFYMAHHLTMISGGSISTDIKKISDISRSLSRWGHGCWCRSEENLLPNGKCGCRYSCWIPEVGGIQDHKYTYFRPGYNSQLLDIQGAFGLEQIKKSKTIHALRKINQNKIRECFNLFLPEIKFPETLPNCDISWFGSCIICPSIEFKNNLVNYLEKSGIQTRDFFGKNILTQPGFAKYGDWRKYPVANDLLYRLFFIGANPNYTEENFEYLSKILVDYK